VQIEIGNRKKEAKKEALISILSVSSILEKIDSIHPITPNCFVWKNCQHHRRPELYNHFKRNRQRKVAGITGEW
jgi:hypothetical protein